MSLVNPILARSTRSQNAQTTRPGKTNHTQWLHVDSHPYPADNHHASNTLKERKEFLECDIHSQFQIFPSTHVGHGSLRLHCTTSIVPGTVHQLKQTLHTFTSEKQMSVDDLSKGHYDPRPSFNIRICVQKDITTKRNSYRRHLQYGHCSKHDQGWKAEAHSIFSQSWHVRQVQSSLSCCDPATETISSTQVEAALVITQCPLYSKCHQFQMILSSSSVSTQVHLCS